MSRVKSGASLTLANTIPPCAVAPANAASASNPGGYNPMLLFFALLSLAAFVCSVLLWLRDRPGRELLAPGRA